MKTIFQHTSDQQITISDGNNSYYDSLENFLLDYPVYKGLPNDFTERIYIPETIHVLSGVQGQVMQTLPWTEGDQYIGQVERLLAKQVARTKPLMLSLVNIKEFKWAAIKMERDHLEQAGIFYLGKVLDSDSVSVQRIAIAAQAAQAAISAGQDFSILWTCQDDSVLELTSEQICGLSMALAMHSNELHQTARRLKKAIDEAETSEELEAISWPEQL